VNETKCPDCGHTWRAHQRRNSGDRCHYNNLTRAGCPCRRKNPDIEAEERHAAALWNMWMGRK
jgi:hypothetical protein